MTPTAWLSLALSLIVALDTWLASIPEERFAPGSTWQLIVHFAKLLKPPAPPVALLAVLLLGGCTGEQRCLALQTAAVIVGFSWFIALCSFFGVHMARTSIALPRGRTPRTRDMGPAALLVLLLAAPAIAEEPPMLAPTAAPVIKPVELAAPPSIAEIALCTAQTLPGTVGKCAGLPAAPPMDSRSFYTALFGTIGATITTTGGLLALYLSPPPIGR